ncbi:MAG: RagB/SusD family nutrient uptake outer membrane protein [Bacteroides sp.]|nr:RagB/SusD family nutrient uptake outer membrane protein [Bacteroides sp.]
MSDNTPLKNESLVRKIHILLILYRYADVVLMIAEIENSLNGTCATYINQIRQRAYGENYDSNVAYQDKSFVENELAILKERDKEFVSEGKRWFDLLRLQDASKRLLVFSASAAYANDNMEPEAVLDYATESYKVLWPIERSLMTYDPLLKQTINYPTKKTD